MHFPAILTPWVPKLGSNKLLVSDSVSKILGVPAPHSYARLHGDSPGDSPGAAAPAPVKQEPVGHRAKRIFLIHEEAHLCTTQFLNSTLEPWWFTGCTCVCEQNYPVILPKRIDSRLYIALLSYMNKLL